MNIGFIGLGIMGRPMAKNLLKAGYALTVYDKFAKFDDLVALGAKAGTSNKDVAAKSDLIITMLPNSPNVREAVLGKDGVVDGAKPGTIVVDMRKPKENAVPERSQADSDARLKQEMLVMKTDADAGKR